MYAEMGWTEKVEKVKKLGYIPRWLTDDPSEYAELFAVLQAHEAQERQRKYPPRRGWVHPSRRR